MLNFLHRRRDRQPSAKTGGKPGRDRGAKAKGKGGKTKTTKSQGRGWAAGRKSGRHAFEMPVLVDMSPFAQATRATRASQDLFGSGDGARTADQNQGFNQSPPPPPPPVTPRFSGMSAGLRLQSPTAAAAAVHVRRSLASNTSSSSPITVAVAAKLFHAPHLTKQSGDIVAPPIGELEPDSDTEGHAAGRAAASPEHMYVDFPISTKRGSTGSTGSIVVPPLWNRSRRGSQGSFAGKRPSLHHGGGTGRRRHSSTDSLVSQLSGYYVTPSSSSCMSPRPGEPMSPGLRLAFDRKLDFGASLAPEKLSKLAEEDTTVTGSASSSPPVPGSGHGAAAAAAANTAANAASVFYSAAGGRSFTMENAPPTPMSASLPGPGPRPRRRASSVASAGPYTLEMAPPPRPRRRSSFVQLNTLRHNTGVSRFARHRQITAAPCSRVVADQMLSCRGPGAFLFRESKGVVVLSVFDGASVHHLQVQTDGVAVSPAMFVGSEFRSFIRHYNNAMIGADGLPIKLTTLVLQ